MVAWDDFVAAYGRIDTAEDLSGRIEKAASRGGDQAPNGTSDYRRRKAVLFVCDWTVEQWEEYNAREEQRSLQASSSAAASIGPRVSVSSPSVVVVPDEPTFNGPESAFDGSVTASFDGPEAAPIDGPVVTPNAPVSAFLAFDFHGVLDISFDDARHLLAELQGNLPPGLSLEAICLTYSGYQRGLQTQETLRRELPQLESFICKRPLGHGGKAEALEWYSRDRNIPRSAIGMVDDRTDILREVRGRGFVGFHLPDGQDLSSLLPSITQWLMEVKAVKRGGQRGIEQLQKWSIGVQRRVDNNEISYKDFLISELGIVASRASEILASHGLREPSADAAGAESSSASSSRPLQREPEPSEEEVEAFAPAPKIRRLVPPPQPLRPVFADIRDEFEVYFWNRRFDPRNIEVLFAAQAEHPDDKITIVSQVESAQLKANLLDTIRRTSALHPILHLVATTPRKVGPTGKASFLRALSGNVSDWVVIDDNLEVLQEVADQGGRPLHVWVRGREYGPDSLSWCTGLSEAGSQITEHVADQAEVGIQWIAAHPEEGAQKIGKQPKGTALTQHHLLSLVIHGNDVKALEEFRQRFNYIWEALEIPERPTEASIRSLLFEQLQAHQMMQLHIDRFRNASSQSSKRTWKWLYAKMCDVIEISQLEDNADAIDKALRPKGHANANPAPKAEGEGARTKKEKEKERRDKEEKDKKEKEKKEKKKEKEKAKKEKKKAEKQAQEEAEAAAAAAPPKGKGKGRGKSPRTPKTKDEKAKLPCMYFAYDACTAGDKCEYSHDKDNMYKGAAFASAIPAAEASIPDRGHAAQDGKGSPAKVTEAVKYLGWLPEPGKVEIAQAVLDTMKANASEQLRRSPAKGAAAVASILQDIESMHPDCKAMTAEANEAAKQVPQGLPYRNHLLRQVGSETMFEICNDEISILGKVNEEFGINHFRLTDKNTDVSDPQQTESLKKLVVLGQGGHVSFEWPKRAKGWALPELASFIKRHNLYEAIADGCAHGSCNKDGVAHQEPWRIITSSWKLAQNLDAKSFQREPDFHCCKAEASKTSRTTRYPKSMAYTILSSLYSKISSESAAMPITTFVQSPHSQRDQKDSVFAGIHHPIDRKDWHRHPGGPQKELMSRKEPINVGINLNLAYGAAKNHKSTQSDVVKAYPQSELNTKVPTWVELPVELTPKEFQHIEKPCVRLKRALYGHPESGYHWNARFKSVVESMGGKHCELFQSSYWFADSKLLLTLYVDDIILSGPEGAHDAFWSELQTHLEIEPPTPVDRVLGRKHLFEKTALGSKMRHNMSDYAANACSLYEELPGRSLKPAATPFVPEGSLLATDWESKGALSPSASRILMKALWLARLSRPDLMKSISDLTRRVTKWSVADDKRLRRLMAYLKGAPDLSIVHEIGDSFEDLHLSCLYTDADHSGDVDHAQSTSGMILCLEGEHSYWPFAWGSKKQTATSRSTTEAEMISLCAGVFGDALPTQEFLEMLTGKETKLICHQDNSAVIAIVHAGYSPKLRHVSI
ncbi:RE1 [Symbiodinium sp. CCMP2592]|nr:RE1 [Symbiodinium sp. CCMP2592]